MKTNKITFNDIEDSKNNLEALQHKLLVERGWTYTSKTPSPYYWLWIKTIDGVRYSLPTDLALGIERCASEDGR